MGDDVHQCSARCVERSDRSLVCGTGCYQGSFIFPAARGRGKKQIPSVANDRRIIIFPPVFAVCGLTHPSSQLHDG